MGMGNRERSKNCVDFSAPFNPKELKMASGVAVAQECKNQFDEIKKGKKHRYVIFYIEDEKMIKVEAVGDRDASYDSFFMDLTKAGEAECRYGLYDFEYEHQCQGTTEVSKKQKLFLMSWCPDTARIKKRCCTPLALMPSKKHSWASTNTFKPRMLPKPVRRALKKN